MITGLLLRQHVRCILSSAQRQQSSKAAPAQAAVSLLQGVRRCSPCQRTCRQQGHAAACTIATAATAQAGSSTEISTAGGGDGGDCGGGDGGDCSGGLYSDPALYDRVFSLRSYADQAEFIQEVFRTHCGHDAASFLEIGCGPARHSAALAKSGLRGYALDNLPVMLKAAQTHIGEAGGNVLCILGDMRQFSLPDPVDVALLLYGTSQHLHTNEDALACFGATARALKPGGLMLVEMLFPEDLFGGYLEEGDTWEVDDEEGQLEVRYGGGQHDEFDAMSQTLQRTVEVFDMTSGKQRHISRERILQRFFTAQEIDLSGRASGMKVVAHYGSLELPLRGLDDEDSYALVLVLQK